MQHRRRPWLLLQGHYSERDAASLIRKILSAIEYIHNEHDIVHRDLKPENFLFKVPTPLPEQGTRRRNNESTAQFSRIPFCGPSTRRCSPVPSHSPSLSPPSSLPSASPPYSCDHPWPRDGVLTMLPDFCLLSLISAPFAALL